MDILRSYIWSQMPDVHNEFLSDHMKGVKVIVSIKSLSSRARTAINSISKKELSFY